MDKLFGKPIVISDDAPKLDGGKVIRCPKCAGVRVLIDKFDHSKFMLCPVCWGRGKLLEIRIK